MRVIIAGGRDFANYELLKHKCDAILSSKPATEIVCGMARGADILGYRYAQERGYSISEYPAEWNKFGKKAGYIRNKTMSENADALIAFWDGKSPGTKSMIELAEEKGLLTRIIRY